MTFPTSFTKDIQKNYLSSAGMIKMHIMHSEVCVKFIIVAEIGRFYNWYMLLLASEWKPQC